MPLLGPDYIHWTQSELYLHRQFTVDDRYVQLPLNISAAGDITVIFYHARSTFGGKIQGKVRFENSDCPHDCCTVCRGFLTDSAWMTGYCCRAPSQLRKWSQSRTVPLTVWWTIMNQFWTESEWADWAVRETSWHGINSSGNAVHSGLSRLSLWTDPGSKCVVYAHKPISASSHLPSKILACEEKPPPPQTLWTKNLLLFSFFFFSLFAVVDSLVVCVWFGVCMAPAIVDLFDSSGNTVYWSWRSQSVGVGEAGRWTKRCNSWSV